MLRIGILAAATAGVILLSSSSAWAIEEFPVALQNRLRLGYTPPCSVCHESGLEGIGTVSTPFGLNMRWRGLNANDAQSIYTAVDKLGSDRADSDGDGVPDVEELQAGTDPNRYGNAPLLAQQEPGFGCSTSPGLGERHLISAVLLALGLSGFRRRRRNDRPLLSR